MELGFEIPQFRLAATVGSENGYCVVVTTANRDKLLRPGPGWTGQEQFARLSHAHYASLSSSGMNDYGNPPLPSHMMTAIEIGTVTWTGKGEERCALTKYW